MHYTVSRNGQTYGPYTLEDLQRYVASGNVLLTDMAKNEEMAEWIPVSDVLGAQAVAAPPAAAGFSTPGYADPAAYAPVAGGAYPGGVAPAYGGGAALAASPYPDAPNLHWGLVLLFSFITCSLFMWVWNLVVAAWLRKVQPNATSLYYYLGAAVLLVLQVLVGGASGMHQAMMHPGIGASATHTNPTGLVLSLLTWVVRLVARFSQRASLEEHFNGPEPVGLQLNPVMTFFFGGLYFQAELNRINAMKLAARGGVPQAY